MKGFSLSVSWVFQETRGFGKVLERENTEIPWRGVSADTQVVKDFGFYRFPLSAFRRRLK